MTRNRTGGYIGAEAAYPTVLPGASVPLTIDYEGFATDGTTRTTNPTITFSSITNTGISSGDTVVVYIGSQSTTSDYHDHASVTIGGVTATQAHKVGGAASYTTNIDRTCCGIYYASGISSSPVEVVLNTTGSDVARSICIMWTIDGVTDSELTVHDTAGVGSDSILTQDTLTVDAPAGSVLAFGISGANDLSTLTLTGVTEDVDTTYDLYGGGAGGHTEITVADATYDVTWDQDSATTGTTMSCLVVFTA